MNIPAMTCICSYLPAAVPANVRLKSVSPLITATSSDMSGFTPSITAYDSDLKPTVYKKRHGGMQWSKDSDIGIHMHLYRILGIENAHRLDIVVRNFILENKCVMVHRETHTDKSAC